MKQGHLCNQTVVLPVRTRASWGLAACSGASTEAPSLLPSWKAVGASGVHLGSLWEASGKPLGSIWEASGKPLGSRRGAPGEPLGSLWEPQVILWELGTSGEPLGSLLRTSREPPGNLWEASGEPFGNPCGLGLWKALQLGKVCLCNGLHKIN